MTDWQIRQGDVREVLAGMDDQYWRGEMEGQPEVAAERFEEMLELELVFPDERIEVRQWIGECVGALYLKLQGASTVEEKLVFLGGFGKAMWQEGREIALQERPPMSQ